MCDLFARLSADFVSRNKLSLHCFDVDPLDFWLLSKSNLISMKQICSLKSKEDHETRVLFYFSVTIRDHVVICISDEHISSLIYNFSWDVYATVNLKSKN